VFLSGTEHFCLPRVVVTESQKSVEHLSSFILMARNFDPTTMTKVLGLLSVSPAWTLLQQQFKGRLLLYAPC